MEKNFLPWSAIIKKCSISINFGRQFPFFEWVEEKSLNICLEMDQEQILKIIAKVELL